MPGRAADGFQVTLFEPLAIGAGQFHEIVFRPVERGWRPLGLGIETLEIRAGAVLERHVAPVLHCLSPLDTQSRVENQNRFALTRQLIGHHCANNAGTDNDHVSRGIAIGKHW